MQVANSNHSFEDNLKAKINAFGREQQLNWVYGNDRGGLEAVD
jgi:hypothetical protein